jgi:hypothetical protein
MGLRPAGGMSEDDDFVIAHAPKTLSSMQTIATNSAAITLLAAMAAASINQ